MSVIKKVFHWYFSKNVLPYWIILLLDIAIVFFSGLLVFFVAEGLGATYEQRWPLLHTALLYALISLVGARLFRTYTGVLRYSSFADLMKLAYANLVNMGVAIALNLVMGYFGLESWSAINIPEIIVIFVLATLCSGP